MKFIIFASCFLNIVNAFSADVIQVTHPVYTKCSIYRLMY